MLDRKIRTWRYPLSMRLRISVFPLLVLTAILTGCAATPAIQWPQLTGHLAAKHKLSTVPFYPQKTYQCGPAALAMALSWSGIPVGPDILTPEVFTPSKKGSLQSAMIAAARRHGRIAYPISGANALLEEIAAGYPVIVLQNLSLSWYPVWHYALVIGYELDQRVMILHSGVTPRKHISIKAFANTWSRSDYWGLVVLPPSRLPATATEHTYIAAVLGLEKAHQWKAAVEGYKTALTRWPDSLSTRIGLGNSYYALGDLKSAETVLRETTIRFPTAGVGFNNLAQVLWEQGNKQEAVKAARRAVELGGPHVKEYQKTLDEIQTQPP